MVWNWQLPDWPQFRYESAPIAELEKQFLIGLGEEAAFLKTIDRAGQQQFIVEILSQEGMESSRIEGEFLDRESLQSSVQAHFGLKTPKKASGA